MKHFNLFWAVLACLSLSDFSYGQCSLACNDLVNVSLPPEGFGVITPDMVLDGDETFCTGPKTVTVTTLEGVILHDTVTCDQLNFTLNVTVLDINSGTSCWGTLFIQDYLPPVITCSDLTVDCTDDLSPTSLGFPTVTDNCDASPNLNYSGQPVMQPCNSQFSAILMRTWHATDESNNHAAPCVQKIFVKRPSFADIVFPPNRDGIQAPALACGSPNTNPTNTGFPTIDGKPVIEFCKMSATFEDMVIGGCANEQSIIRSWTVLNCCTNEVLEHNQIIKIADDSGPVINCPGTLNFGTNGPGCAGTFFLPALSATDNCSSNITWRTLAPWGILNSNGGMAYGIATGNYVVTYEAKDACGNKTTCQVNVVVSDNVAPVGICIEYTVVALSSTGLASLAANLLNNGSYDACCPSVSFLAKRMDQPAAPFTPTVQFTCADVSAPVAIILQIKDCHGNTNTCMVQVTVQDKTPPSLNCPPAITIPCSTLQPPSVTLTGWPAANDACGIDTVFFADAENLSMCNVGTITRTFTAVDVAGFTKTCTQTIKMVDNSPSQFFFPPDTVVGCDRPIDSLLVGEPEVVADCELFGLNVSDDVFPVACGLKIYRTYTYKDWCSGADTSYVQFIKVEDNEPPVWNDPAGAQDFVFLCGSDVVKPPAPTATDFCSTDSVYVISDVTIPGTCPNRFTRILTYGAQDSCGNVATPFVQTILVNDVLPPTASPLPTIGPFTCYSTMPAPNPNVVLGETDNCIGPVTVTWVSDGPNPGCSGTVVRTYRLADACGNTALITQNILIKDNEAPTANPLPTLNLACANQVPLPITSVVTGAADNCGGAVTVGIGTDTGSPGCEGTITRTYRLTDVCNNSRLITQLIHINDSVPPIVTSPDTIRQTVAGLGCQTFVTVQANVTDNCPSNPVITANSFNGNGSNASGFYPVGETIVTFTSTDACGNVGTKQTVVLVDENENPSADCASFELELDSLGMAIVPLATLIANGTIEGMDACTDVTITIDPDSVSCDDYISEMDPIIYTVVVTDEFGNTASCSSGFFLLDPFNVCVNDDPGLVSGLIFNEAHEPLVGVEVQMFDNTNMSQTHTQAYGRYLFQDVPPGMSCQLQPVKNDDLLNGVTTFDLVLLSRHILGTQPLDSPYKILAADVNNSGNVSTFDIVALRKAILQVTNSFPNNNSWRFIEAGYQFPNPANPFVGQVPESTWVNTTGSTLSGRNFVAVKVGDLNGSADLDFNEAVVSERHQSGELTLSVPNWQLKAGKEVRIPVTCGEAIDLSALQGTIEFDASKMDFVGAVGEWLEGLGADNFGEPAPGTLTLGWHDATDRALEAGSTLFYLQFLMHEDASIEEILAMNSTTTPAIAYKNGGIPLNVRWRIHEAPQMPVDAAPLFSLGQNRPNPFNDETRIGFMLKEKMAVHLEIIDLSGRKTTVLKGKREAGWHEVVVDKSMMGGPGVYIYQLTTPSGTERHKMVFQ